MRRRTRPSAVLAFAAVCFAVSVILLALSIAFSGFAEAFSISVGAAIRMVLALAACFVPFSLAEIGVIVLPLALTFWFIRCIVRCVRQKSARPLGTFFIKLLAGLLFASSLFIVSFGICYRRTPVDTRVPMVDEALVTRECIETAAVMMNERAKAVLPDIEFTDNGASRMPYAFPALCETLTDAYHRRFSESPAVFSVKPVMLSEPLTYTHLSGVYMPFTGESNVNVHYPDFIVAYTCAHEMAHQMGIASENEANFYAFAVCFEADDPYLVYAACMNLLDYLFADLDHEGASRVIAQMPDEVIGEFAAYSAFFRKYAQSGAAELASAVNDSYLKSQGVAAGVKSYGEVTSLAVRYLMKQYPFQFR